MKTITLGMMGMTLAVMFSFVTPATAQQAPQGAGVESADYQQNAAEGQTIEQTSYRNNCQCQKCQPRQSFVCRHGGYCDSRCPTNYCPQGTCPSCYQSQCMCLHNLMWKCTKSPGHGWCPPSKYPVSPRAGVAYIKYWPTYWSGQGPGEPIQYNPVVYTPTDTTQLGYYYQHVPQWYRMPGMIPPKPHPSQWHVRDCGYGANCQSCQYGSYHGGVVVSEGSHADAKPIEKADEPAGEDPPVPPVE